MNLTWRNLPVIATATAEVVLAVAHAFDNSYWAAFYALLAAFILGTWLVVHDRAHRERHRGQR